MSAGRPPSPKVPNRIRAMRMLNGMTKTQLARKLHVSSVSVNNWEDGTAPNVYAAQKLIRLFDLTFEELFPMDYMDEQ